LVQEAECKHDDRSLTHWRPLLPYRYSY